MPPICTRLLCAGPTGGRGEAQEGWAGERWPLTLEACWGDGEPPTSRTRGTVRAGAQPAENFLPTTLSSPPVPEPGGSGPGLCAASPLPRGRPGTTRGAVDHQPILMLTVAASWQKPGKARLSPALNPQLTRGSARAGTPSPGGLQAPELWQRPLPWQEDGASPQAGPAQSWGEDWPRALPGPTGPGHPSFLQEALLVQP